MVQGLKDSDEDVGLPESDDDILGLSRKSLGQDSVLAGNLETTAPPNNIQASNSNMQSMFKK